MRAAQVKELIRLGSILRIELHLDDVLQQVIASISTSLGFHSASINLLDESKGNVVSMAWTGLSPEDVQFLQDRPLTLEQVHRLMRPEYRISQSYYISHEVVKNQLHDIPWIHNEGEADEIMAGAWHPADALIVPLWSLRSKKIMGFISLDNPDDGNMISLETIEMVELFANQAAIAIDNSLLFEERERERLELDEAITSLRRDLQKLQRGDMRVRVQTRHEKLQPITDSVNTMVDEINALLSNVQMMTQAVDEHTQDVRHGSDLLVQDTDYQERQVRHISETFTDMTEMMQKVSDKANQLSLVATEAMDVTTEGQSVVDRAVEGMGEVRESTRQSARVMKRLGESGQEINAAISALTDLTTRMNLLALNAAIEAARAGEHGQGFAIIAQEIRHLAVNSSEAARQIASQMRSIQHETSSVSLSIEQNTEKVMIQTELVMQTGVALDAISIVMEQMEGLVKGICSGSQDQFQASQRVVGSVDEISRMTTDISQHTRSMQQSLNHLVELADSLQSRMSIFQLAEPSN